MEQILKRSHNQIKLVQTRADTLSRTNVYGNRRQSTKLTRDTHSRRRRMVREKEGRPAIEKERKLHCMSGEVANNESGKERITYSCCVNGCFAVGSSYDSFCIEVDATAAAADSTDRSFSHM